MKHVIKKRPLGMTLWFTGLSGSGKSTLCSTVQKRLVEAGLQVQILDGDLVRNEICSDLGFSKRDRDENVRRLTFIANLLTRNSIIVLVAAISPYRDARKEARRKIKQFMEIYVNAPLEICEGRDPKGIYAKARRGMITGITGLDDPYEPPIDPELECKTHEEDIDACTEAIVAKFIDRYILEAVNAVPPLPHG